MYIQANGECSVISIKALMGAKNTGNLSILDNAKTRDIP